jgi:hypothetical protein
VYPYGLNAITSAGTVLAIMTGTSLNQPVIGRHSPGSTASWFFPPSDFITLPSTANWFPGFFLDGRERIWALEGTWIGALPEMWSIVPVTSPHRPIARVPLAHHGPLLSAYSTMGAATLHTYALYTDPMGDLDGDGIPNRQELQSGSNPFVSSPPPVSLTMTVPPAMTGGWVTLQYTAPTEAGMPAFAPFTTRVEPEWFGTRSVPVSMADPFIPWCLMTNLPWLSGTLGVMDANGQLSVRLRVPPGIPPNAYIFNTLATADAGLTTLRQVSPAYTVIF